MTATDNVIEIPPQRPQQHPVRRRVLDELVDSLNHIERAEIAMEGLRLDPANMASCAGSAPPETASTTWSRRFRGLWSAYAVLLLVFGEQA